MRRLFLAQSLLSMLLVASSGCSVFEVSSEPPVPGEPVVLVPVAPPVVAPLLEPVAVAVAVEVVPEDEPEPAPVAVVRKVKKKAPTPVEKKPLLGPNGMRRASFALPKTKPTVLGSARIKSIISQRLPQVRACYERELKRNSGLKGKVTAAWTIETDGSVRGVRITKNTTGNGALAPCIIKSLSKWRFPASRAPSDVEYPFVFRMKETWR